METTVHAPLQGRLDNGLEPIIAEHRAGRNRGRIQLSAYIREKLYPTPVFRNFILEAVVTERFSIESDPFGLLSRIAPCGYALNHMCNGRPGPVF
jgi:hypothetical protein